MFSNEATGPAQEALAQLRSAVDLLQTLDLTGATDDDVLELLRELETQKRRLPTVEHTAIGEVETRQLAHERACRDTAALLRQLLRLEPTQARARVRAAAALGPRRSLTGQVLPAIHPQTAAACAAGTISQRHAAAITATIDHLPAAIQAELDTTVEGILLGHAHDLDPKLLRVAARDLAAALDQDGILAQHRDRQRHRALTVHQHADGTATLHGRLDAICTELLLTYLDSAARPRPAANGSKDPRSAAQRRHDAVNDAFHTLLRSGVLPDCGGVVASIMLTMTEQQLSSHHGTVTTGHGARITVPEALTLLGDAQLTPITLTKTKKITAYGDTHRIFTQNQRLAMTARDGGCSFPACDVPPAWCQAHHVTDYAITRHTRVDDGTLLCGFHHREHPNLGWTCTMLDGIPHWTPPRWLDPHQTPRRNRMHHPALQPA